MTVTATLQIPADWDFAKLNAQVVIEENRHGPLISIGHDNSFTLLTFNNSPEKPKKNAVIAAQVAGVPQIPTGSDLVCTGTIFCKGVLTLSAATRPK